MQNLIEDREIFLCALKESVEETYSSINENLNFIYSAIKEDKKNHFVSRSQEELDKISYARSEEDKFSSSKRMKTTFERYVRRQLDISESALADHELNFLGKVLRKRLIPQEILNKHMTILSGDDIKYFYEDTCIESCMTGEDNCWKTKLYCLNPEIVKLVFYTNTTKGFARGLLWYHPSGDIILDRTYPNNSDSAEMIKTWAKNNNYVYRVSNGAPEENLIKLSNDKVYDFTLYHNDIFPYLDTFCYGNKYENRIIISNNLNHNHEVAFHSAEGGFKTLKQCSHCYHKVKYIFAINSKYYCETCKEELFSQCSFCLSYFPKKDITQINGYNLCNNCNVDVFRNCHKCCKKDVKYDMHFNALLSYFTCRQCYLSDLTF